MDLEHNENEELEVTPAEPEAAPEAEPETAPVPFLPRLTCYPTWYCEIATSACGLLAMTNLRRSPFC